MSSKSFFFLHFILSSIRCQFVSGSYLWQTCILFDCLLPWCLPECSHSGRARYHSVAIVGLSTSRSPTLPGKSWGSYKYRSPAGTLELLHTRYTKRAVIQRRMSNRYIGDIRHCVNIVYRIASTYRLIDHWIWNIVLSAKHSCKLPRQLPPPFIAAVLLARSCFTRLASAINRPSRMTV